MVFYYLIRLQLIKNKNLVNLKSSNHRVKTCRRCHTCWHNTCYNHFWIYDEVEKPGHFYSFSTYSCVFEDTFKSPRSVISCWKLFSFLRDLHFHSDFLVNEKRLDKKAKVNVKNNDVIDWTANNYNTLIT